MTQRPASACLLAIAALLVLAGAARGQATVVPGTGDQMLQAMMNMMARFAQQVQQTGSAMAAPATAMGSAAMGSAGLGSMPLPSLDLGGSTLPVPAPAPAPATPAAVLPFSELDGAWRADSGEYLLIEGERFRLHADPRRYIDGRMRTQGNIVGFLYPQRRTVLLYRYQVSGDRLLLRDQNGHELRYRRIARALGSG